VKAYLAPLIVFQRFFIPALVLFAVWALWRTVVHKDRGVGVALYLAIVVIVDAFLNTGIYLPGLAKGSIRYSEMFAILLYVNTSPAASAPRVPGMVYWLVGLYFLMMFGSTLRSDSLLSAILEFRQVIIPQIVALLVAKRGLDSPQAYRRFFLCFAGLTIVIGLFTFWDLFFDRVFLHSDVLDKGMYWHNREQNRFGSFFLNPNYLGGFVALVFPVMFVWTLKERSWMPRLFAWAGLLSLLFCLVETQSRAPMLAFAIGLVFLIVGPSGEVSRTRRFGFLAACVGVFFLVMPGFFEHAIGRFDKLEEETSTGQSHSRATTWQYTLLMIHDNPIVGIGFGEPQFTLYMNRYGFSETHGVAAMDAPHNSYLQIAVYAGIPALLVFLLANALLLMKAARRLVTRSSEADRHGGTVFGLAVGLIAFLLSIYPDIQLFTMSVAPVYWVLFAFLHSLVNTAPQPATVTSPVPSGVEKAAPVSWWTAHPPLSGARARGTSSQGPAATRWESSPEDPRDSFAGARWDVRTPRSR
jgi:O-antigen ligase